MSTPKPDTPAVEPCPDLSGLGATPRQHSPWSVNDLPELQGCRTLITGGAGGLGLATARVLAGQGAAVILADVNATAGRQAVDTLQRECPQAQVEFRQLDLAHRPSVREFAATLNESGQALDLLVNLAGIYPPARRRLSQDGTELALTINYLGHFALTGLLLPSLLASASPRVVSVSSITQAWARLDPDQPDPPGPYRADQIYARSKLACLMFGLELASRAQSAGSGLQSMVAHPGVARTQLGRERRQAARGLRARLEDAAQAGVMRWFGQMPAQGALPILYAAAATAAVNGGFYGPDGLGQFAGNPVAVRPCRAARDAENRARLWRASEMLTETRISL